ncbi:murein L,D-transpeptidase catalytic domain family protein [Brumimicrobium glaciale]|nr:murein L,D-transpeptidase catalytic domain family protein [Brumimicrobium glaciale]
MLNKKPLQTIALLSVMVLFFSFTTENIPVSTNDVNLDFHNQEHIISVKGKPTAINFWEQYVYSNYECLGDTTLTYEAFYNGLKGYYALKEKGILKQEGVLTIVDFTQHSSKERMYIINVNTFEIIKKTLCSHGKNTGAAMATSFSNTNGSLQSSLGFFLTAETYSGKFDYAMRLDGLEKANSRARERGIVVHGANYATPEFLERNGGVLGRSYGCPALPKDDATELIDEIKEGTCFFIYSNDFNYLQSSDVINSYRYEDIIDELNKV